MSSFNYHIKLRICTQCNQTMPCTSMSYSVFVFRPCGTAAHSVPMVAVMHAGEIYGSITVLQESIGVVMALSLNHHRMVAVWVLLVCRNIEEVCICTKKQLLVKLHREGLENNQNNCCSHLGRTHVTHLLGFCSSSDPRPVPYVFLFCSSSCGSPCSSRDWSDPLLGVFSPFFVLLSPSSCIPLLFLFIWDIICSCLKPRIITN